MLHAFFVRLFLCFSHLLLFLLYPPPFFFPLVGTSSPSESLRPSPPAISSSTGSLRNSWAHQGAAAYREEFDLLYRREATHANAMWQADHTPLDVLLLDETGTPAKPWLTAIEDDYSRMIVAYRLSFQKSTALNTALALRQ